jgi:hypothetical protein
MKLVLLQGCLGWDTVKGVNQTAEIQTRMVSHLCVRWKGDAAL